MTKKEKWIVDEDDELRLFYGDENFNGSAYPCNDIVFMKMIADKLNKLEEENNQLRLELDTHKHPLWSTREAERIVNELKQENEQLKKELTWWKYKCGEDLND